LKRPAFQFYPADWRKDAALQSCSLAAQGMWMNMLCIAHECEPYGHLTINGLPMSAAQIGRLVGLNAKECQPLLTELLDAGVVSTTPGGVLFSRRMVRDERLRNVRADAGRLGGNPTLVGSKVKQLDNQMDNQASKQSPTPSSSSSSSTSVKERARGSRLPPDWTPGPDGEAFAAQHGIANGKAVAELAKFRDYWTAQPGQKGVKTDWLATWRNWLRRASEGQPRGAGDDPMAGAL
jgi:DnaT DNA-binding domain